MTTEETIKEQHPSKGRYIGVWVLSGVVSAIPVAICSGIMSEVILMKATGVNDFLVRAFFVTLVLTAIALGVWIGIYRLFNDLMISKVMPYLWFFGALGVIWNTFMAFGVLEELIGELFLLYVFFLCAFNFSFSSYFKRTQPHRY